MYRLHYVGNVAPPDRPGVVGPVRVDPRGLLGPTPDEARGPGWRSPFRGWHVPAGVALTVDQRIVEAATLAVSCRGLLTGWAALRWCGGVWFEGSIPGDPHGMPIDIVAPRDLRPRPGIRVSEERFGPADRVFVDGVAVTPPVRSVAYVMRYAAGVREAVRALDMAAYSDLVSLREASEYVGAAPRQGLSGWTGVPQAREAIALGNENAWSPTEVTLQLIWTLDAGLPPPLLNQPVFDLAGRHLGTPDLLDLEAGVIGEYNGAAHLAAHRAALDHARAERFRDVGLEGFTATGVDLTDVDALVRRMHAARARAAWLPASDRGWTIDPPDWWIPTTTVEQRRTLTPSQQARLLGYRRPA